MSVLVVGSVAYDSVKTSAGSRDDALGGSATFFSIASSYFTPVSVVAVVGEDFRQEHIDMLESHHVDVSGLERASGKTFRWAGVYGTEDVNTRDTLDTQLNVFADFSPTLSAEQSRRPYLFLANIDPGLQLDVLQQMHRRPELVALDTMNFWMDNAREDLEKVIAMVDILAINDEEARQLSGEYSLVKAAMKIMEMGPNYLIIKKGEHGALLFHGNQVFFAPALPLEEVFDPTGAGDTFAGGFIGFLAKTDDVSFDNMKRAIIFGSAMASFCVEKFGPERLKELTQEMIDERVQEFIDLVQFDITLA
ncbi:MAG: sugar kinase [Bacteroidetes bacterium]|nr:sugar kinase [Bacteroidota bacterium]